MNGRKFSMLAAILVLAAAIVAHRVEALHADEDGITLASLAGGFAVSDSGIGTFCVGGCAAPTKLVPFNSIHVGQVTFDGAGNYCGVLTAVGLPVAGSSKLLPAGAATFAGTVTAFDPITQSGDITHTIYDGGSCSGAVFNGNGATIGGTVTAKIVVSQNANHLAFAARFAPATGSDPHGGNFFLGAFDRQNFQHEDH